MIPFLIIEALAGLSLFRWLRNRSGKHSLSAWAATPSVPVFSSMLDKATGGEIADRKKRILANVFKSGVRKYVASDLFDSAVNGMFNRQSLIHGLASRLKNRGSSDLFSGSGEVSEAFR